MPTRRLHLGCGQVYLPGYENIDFPPEQHTVQASSVADTFVDLRTLRQPVGSVDEVRLHHVFEHFSRATAAALLLSWRSWLKTGGCVHIEVPDFDRTARSVLSPLSSHRTQQVGLRHIFGSHEAGWAVHQHGWSRKRLRDIARAFAFDVRRLDASSYKGTFNCTMVATRSDEEISEDAAVDRIATYLREFTLDDSVSERKLFEIWMDEARRQLAATWAS